MNVIHVPGKGSGVPEETVDPPFMELIVQLLLCGLETELW